MKKAKRILPALTVAIVFVGYHFAKDIFNIGIKDGHNTAVKMHMVKAK